MNTYYIVRHGKTEWNTMKRTQGKKDSPLTAEGIAMAKTLRKRLEHISLDRVYSSDLKRAVDTAYILAPDKKIELLSGLREIDFGVWEGLTIEEIKSRYGELYSQWTSKPDQVSFLEGESMENACQRVKQTFWNIDANQDGKKILIVAHAMIIKLLMVSLLEAPLSKIFHMVQGNLALNIIKTRKGVADIITMNDTTHIENIK